LPLRAKTRPVKAGIELASPFAVTDFESNWTSDNTSTMTEG